MRLNKRLTYTQAALFILASVFCISIPAWSAWLIYCKFFDVRATNPFYNITAIVQTGPGHQTLSASYLAELLDLSQDKPKNIYQINLKEEQEKLKASPIIKSAILKRIPPSTLYIDYTLREPIAYLADVSNTVIDEEGVVFPLKPFFSPKKLPSIYLGIDQELVWGNKLESERLAVAMKILEQFSHLEILSIDVANLFAESLGKQQVVVSLSKDGQTFILRLPCTEIDRKIKEFEKIITITKAGAIIDFRLPNLAFITKQI